MAPWTLSKSGLSGSGWSFEVAFLMVENAVGDEGDHSPIALVQSIARFDC